MKKIFFLATIIILLVIIQNLIVSIYDLWSKRDIVAKASQTLENEKKKNQELKAKLEEVENTEFIETEARNKLFLVKPGEQEVIIPDELVEKKEVKKPEKEIENWEKWLSLFF